MSLEPEEDLSSCGENTMLLEPEEDLSYPEGTLISAHTNKPIPLGDKSFTKLPVFWCDVCTLKLASPSQAIQHFSGKSHHTTATPKADSITPRKRDLDSNSNPEEEGDEPATKKKKVDQSVQCKECDIILNSELMAEQHFKGKKHASTLKKLELAANPPPPATPPPVVNKTSYCQFCCVTLNSDGQVQQHNNGTRHKVNAGIIPPEHRGRGRRAGHTRGTGTGIRAQGIGGSRGGVTRGAGVNIRAQGRGGITRGAGVNIRAQGRGITRGANVGAQGRGGRGIGRRGRGYDEAPKRGRGWGNQYDGQDWGRGHHHRRGQGEGHGWGPNRWWWQEPGEQQGRGNTNTRRRFGRGNSGMRGRGVHRGANRGFHDSSVPPVGKQYENTPSNANTNYQNGECANVHEVDSSYHFGKPTEPPGNHYTGTTENASTGYYGSEGMQSFDQGQDYSYYNYNSKNYHGGAYAPTSSEVKYDSAHPPIGKGNDSGNYYTNGYWHDNSIMKTDYQTNSDAMYDAYYG